MLDIRWSGRANKSLSDPVKMSIVELNGILDCLLCFHSEALNQDYNSGL